MNTYEIYKWKSWNIMNFKIYVNVFMSIIIVGVVIDDPMSLKF